MADVFISCRRKDRQAAYLIATALEHNGWSVWWDREIAPGQSFPAVITSELDRARCVVVIWSQHSVANDWVKGEAREGRERGILVSVSVDGVKPPLGFTHLQSADLQGWTGDPSHPECRRLVQAVADTLGETCRPDEPRPPVTTPRSARLDAPGAAVSPASLPAAGSLSPLAAAADVDRLEKSDGGASGESPRPGARQRQRWVVAGAAGGVIATVAAVGAVVDRAAAGAPSQGADTAPAAAASSTADSEATLRGETGTVDPSTKNRMDCERWCEGLALCVKCDPRKSCGVGHERLRSWTGDGPNWHACANRTPTLSTDNHASCERWCASTARCDRCDTRVGCGVGYEKLRSWSGDGLDWFACAKQEMTPLGRHRACQQWCAANSVCAKCNPSGCGAGYKRLKSWTGRGTNWHACARR